METSKAAPQPAKTEFLKLFALPVLWLFLLPVVALIFTQYGESKFDSEFEADVQAKVAASTKMDDAQKTATLAFFRDHPPSRICRSSEADVADLRARMCESGDTLWQFVLAKRVAAGCLFLGLVGVLGAASLGLIAFSSRSAQYWSFMLGWRGLTLVCALEIVAQGALATWLSYWVSALLFEVYILKLILVVAVLALTAIWIALRALFRRPPEPQPLQAERVSQSDAPKLWERLNELAAKLGTRPPLHLVAGIDDNFFVAEEGVTLASGKLAGRALYVSLPLLRVLEPSEANAVFSHELAHFQGGDTEASARLWPMLARYDGYMSELAVGGVTRPAFFLMRMFRAIFELALKKESRERELVADRTAAKQTSKDDVGKSLLKITAYSNFRAETERELFGQQKKHKTQLALRERIDAGLGAYALSPHFASVLKTTRTPHPFDTHPLLEERLTNVACSVKVSDAPAMMQARPAHSWADEIGTGPSIEQRLWDAYEARFKEQHERSLAYRYLPSTDEERALVLRFFPELAFAMSKGGALRVSYEGLQIPGFEDALLPFRWIVGAKVQSGNFTNTLIIEYHSTEMAKSAKAKVNLNHLGKQAENFKTVFGSYWQRDQVAREYTQQQREKASAEARSA